MNAHRHACSHFEREMGNGCWIWRWRRSTAPPTDQSNERSKARDGDGQRTQSRRAAAQARTPESKCGKGERRVQGCVRICKEGIQQRETESNRAQNEAKGDGNVAAKERRKRKERKHTTFNSFHFCPTSKLSSSSLHRAATPGPSLRPLGSRSIRSSLLLGLGLRLAALARAPLAAARGHLRLDLQTHMDRNFDSHKSGQRID
jgi:hypothetical protein